jgi:hypothetical protein
MSASRPPMKKPASASSLLSDLLKQRGIAERMEDYRAWQVWDQVVGPQIAARARPLRLRDGVLEIRVDQPVWMQQLQLMKPQILSRLAQRLGRETIRDIYLRRGRIEPGPPPPAPAPPLPMLNEEEKAAVDAAVGQVTDPELRQNLLALFTRQARLDKSRRG